LGLNNIDGVGLPHKYPAPESAYGKLNEKSAGKDTTTGHWEIAGIITQKPFPTFPDGFPQPLIEALSHATGRRYLCNKPMSGTEVIKLYGMEHIKTGSPIIYTSADSVLQIAAHENVIPCDALYDICRTARKIVDEYQILRVIARPFIGQDPAHFTRTPNRRDFSIPPDKNNMLAHIASAGMQVSAIGKIEDIYAGCGVTQSVHTKSNDAGITKIHECMNTAKTGLIVANLVDFDMLYGHRNDIPGYADALRAFDDALPAIVSALNENDILMITADHGCDPSTASTDHSREYIPLLAYGHKVKAANLGIRNTFADIGATICDYLGVKPLENGESFLPLILQ
jgi:phosphopentomutase